MSPRAFGKALAAVVVVAVCVFATHVDVGSAQDIWSPSRDASCGSRGT